MLKRSNNFSHPEHCLSSTTFKHNSEAALSVSRPLHWLASVVVVSALHPGLQANLKSGHGHFIPQRLIIPLLSCHVMIHRSDMVCLLSVVKQTQLHLPLFVIKQHANKSHKEWPISNSQPSFFLSSSLLSVLRQAHSLFQNEFTTECDLVLPLSISSILPFH